MQAALFLQTAAVTSATHQELWAQMGPCSQGAAAVAGQVKWVLCSSQSPQTDAVTCSEWQNGVQAPVGETNISWKT